MQGRSLVCRPMSAVSDTAVSPAFDADIGARMRLFRRGCRKTLSEVAAALEITPQQLQKYESGRNRISAGRLFALAQVLGVPVASFYEELGEPPVHEFAQLLTTLQIRALVLSFARIEDAATRKQLIGLIETLAAKSSQG